MDIPLPSAGLSGMVTRVKPRYPASADDWNAHREHIVQLYCAEDKPLPMVARAMKEAYGFDAT